MRPPSIADFIFQAHVKNLYRKLVKTAYRIPEASTRNETIIYYKGEFQQLTNPEESKARFAFLRNSVTSLSEMIHRSGMQKNSSNR